MKLIIITGQTATGKTALALDYAKKYNGALINCDSRQIYKHLDIITGKDLILTKKHSVKNLAGKTCAVKEERSDGKTAQVKLWLTDVVNPKDYFSSFDYVKSALPVIKKILSEKKTPVIVGGTYLYLRHLLYDIETENIKPDWKLRRRLAGKTTSDLQNLYKKLSLDSFKRLNNSDKNNPQRLIRKIEIASVRSSSQRFQPPGFDLLSRQSKNKEYIILAKKLHFPNLQIQFIGLKFKRKEKLAEAIKNRVEDRLKNGAIYEVQNLLKRGYDENDPGLKTIGYQQIIQFLKKKLTKQEAIAQWTTKEIQYAKRQYTFMKKDKNIVWKGI